MTTLRQSFAWWSFAHGREPAEAEALLRTAAEIGYAGVEMLPESLWGVAADAGLAVVTLTGHDLDVGFNDPANHPVVSRAVSDMIDNAARAAAPFVIVFSGRRGTADDAAAIDHCVAGLAPLAQYAPYFDTQAHPGTVVEISDISGSKGSFFEHIRKVAAGWDGADPIRDVGGR